MKITCFCKYLNFDQHSETQFNFYLLFFFTFMNFPPTSINNVFTCFNREVSLNFTISNDKNTLNPHGVSLLP